MTDPLSVTAAVVGITAAAVQAAQALYITIDNIKDVPATIKGIKVDLQAIEAVLHSLCRELPNDSSQILLNDNIKRAAENINVACTTFRAKLERWMRHSTEDKAFWADRWRVGLFGQETIKTFKAQLNDYKGTLNVALNSATLFIMIRKDHLTEDFKDSMLRQNEEQITRLIAGVNTEQAAIETALQELSTTTGTKLDEESGRNLQLLLKDIDEQKTANETFRKMCNDALSKTSHERKQKIRNVKATNDSTALAGLIGTSGEGLNIDQDISDIMADQGSFVGAGIFQNLDFRNVGPSRGANTRDSSGNG